jgi:hypothetical protein
LTSKTAAQDQAEAKFKKREEKAQEGAQAMAEYQAAGRAVEKNTTRLRALRLAKEAADKEAKTRDKPVAAKRPKLGKKT